MKILMSTAVAAFLFIGFPANAKVKPKRLKKSHKTIEFSIHGMRHGYDKYCNDVSGPCWKWAAYFFEDQNKNVIGKTDGKTYFLFDSGFRYEKDVPKLFQEVSACAKSGKTSKLVFDQVTNDLFEQSVTLKAFGCS